MLSQRYWCTAVWISYWIRWRIKFLFFSTVKTQIWKDISNLITGNVLTIKKCYQLFIFNTCFQCESFGINSCAEAIISDSNQHHCKISHLRCYRNLCRGGGGRHARALSTTTLQHSTRQHSATTFSVANSAKEQLAENK